MLGPKSFSPVIVVVALLALSSTIEARPSKRSPSPHSPNGSPLPNRPNGPGSLSGYSVPIVAGSLSLPSPTGTLKAITIGRGTQNYTCTPSTNSTSATPMPVAIGAVADLLDATPLLQFVTPEEGIKILELLPEYLINFDTNLLAQYTIPLLGHHYFNGAGQPTFDLGSTGFLTAKKVGDIPAPAGASVGAFNQGFGAVDWLSLNDAGGSRSLSQVFRVATAGGKAPPKCPFQSGTIEVQYSALYWFYGS